MRQILLELVSSKKFIAVVVASVVYAGGRLGLRIDEQLLEHIYTALLVYVGAQGVADFGKGATQVREKAKKLEGTGSYEQGETDGSEIKSS